MKSFVKFLLPIVLATAFVPLRGMEPEERTIDSEDNVIFYAQDGKLVGALHLGFVTDQAPGVMQIIRETGSQSIRAPHSPETVKFLVNALIASDQPTFDKNNLKNTVLYKDLQNLTIQNLIAIANCAVWAKYEILQNAIALALAERCANSTIYSPEEMLKSFEALGLDPAINQQIKQQLEPSHNQQTSSSTQTEVTLELANGQTITVPRNQAEGFSSLKNILAGLDEDQSIPLPSLSLSHDDTQLLFKLAEVAGTFQCAETDEEKRIAEIAKHISMQIQDFTFEQINELLTASDYLGSDLLITIFVTILEEKLKYFVVSNDNTQLEHAVPQCSPLFLYRMAQRLLDNNNFISDTTAHYTIGSKILTGHHTAWIRCLALSPDGQTLATGSGYFDKTVKLWNVNNGICKRTLTGHTGENRCLALSSDGETLATGSNDETVKLWNVNSGICKRTLIGHTDENRCLAFSQDGNTLATGSHDKTVRIWDVATGKCKRTLTGHSNWISCLAFSVDGKTLATGSWDTTARIWDVATGKCKRILTGHSGWINCLALTIDGKTLATGSHDNTVRIWDVATGKCKRILTGHSNWINCLALTIDGKTLATGSYDNTVRIWDIATGKCKRILIGHAGVIDCLALTIDGKTLATGSYDNDIKLWDVTNGTCTYTLKGHTGNITCLALSHDGKTLVTGSRDTTVRLWNIFQLKESSPEQLLLLKLCYEAYRAKIAFTIHSGSFLEELYQSSPKQIQMIANHFLGNLKKDDEKEKESEK